MMTLIMRLVSVSSLRRVRMVLEILRKVVMAMGLKRRVILSGVRPHMRMTRSAIFFCMYSGCMSLLFVWHVPCTLDVLVCCLCGLCHVLWMY
ncbi:hypothetical protein ACFX1Q_000428 [Malus domestica]